MQFLRRNVDFSNLGADRAALGGEKFNQLVCRSQHQVSIGKFTCLRFQDCDLFSPHKIRVKVAHTL